MKNTLIIGALAVLTLGACEQYKVEYICSEDAVAWDKVGEPIEFNEFCSEVAVPYGIIPMVHHKDSPTVTPSVPEVVTPTDTPTTPPSIPPSVPETPSDPDVPEDDTPDTPDTPDVPEDDTPDTPDAPEDDTPSGNPGNDKDVGKAGEQDKDVGESGGSRGASTGKDERL